MNHVAVFKRLLVQISMVSSRGMLLKSKSIPKLPMKLLESCSTVSVAMLNESLTVYLLLVNGSKIGTKYFASLYVGVWKADKIGLKGGQPSTHFLCTLQEPCIIPSLVPTSFRCLRVSSDMLLESTSKHQVLEKLCCYLRSVMLLSVVLFQVFCICSETSGCVSLTCWYIKYKMIYWIDIFEVTFYSGDINEGTRFIFSADFLNSEERMF